ncbi:hypothetical protein Tco_0135161, partial [Tanacetum coccineum]
VSFQNSLQSKIDQNLKIRRSVFISNILMSVSSMVLWRDAFRFCFGSLLSNLDRLIENLKTIWIGRFHLSANTARFERPKASTFQKEKPVPSGTFVNEALFHFHSRCLARRLWVMIELKSSKSKSKFMEHVGVASWFRRLCNAQSDFAAKERIVWVDIEGVPLNAWTRSTFQKISSKWGELVELEDGEGFLGSCQGTFCLVSIFKDVPENELFGRRVRRSMNKQIPELDEWRMLSKNTDTSTHHYPPGFTPANDIPSCNNQNIPEAESDRPPSSLSSRVDCMWSYNTEGRSAISPNFMEQNTLCDQDITAILHGYLELSIILIPMLGRAEGICIEVSKFPTTPIQMLAYMKEIVLRDSATGSLTMFLKRISVADSSLR